MNQTTSTEFEVFKAIHKALEPLDDEARSRVVKSINTLLAIDAHVQAEPEEAAADKAAEGAPTYSTFAELYAAANPTTNGNRALVAGYWIQVCQGSENFTAQAANKELNQLGEGIGNITMALDALKKQKPALVLQLSKSGKTKQARKTYKINVPGVRWVREAISG